MPPRRPCQQCGVNRAERFFKGARGRKCTDCLRKNRSRSGHSTHIWRLYRLTRDMFDTLFSAQGNACAGCGESRKYNLCVDHDHDPTNPYVRGLLCKRCNKVLAQVRDRAEILQNLAEYLDSPPAFMVLGKIEVGEAPLRNEP